MTFSDILMTKAEVAELLRCSERTIERQVKDQQFPPPERFGKQALWFQSVVIAWLEQRRVQQARWLAHEPQSTAVSQVQTVATAGLAVGARQPITAVHPRWQCGVSADEPPTAAQARDTRGQARQGKAEAQPMFRRSLA